MHIVLLPGLKFSLFLDSKKETYFIAWSRSFPLNQFEFNNISLIWMWKYEVFLGSEKRNTEEKKCCVSCTGKQLTFFLRSYSFATYDNRLVKLLLLAMIYWCAFIQEYRNIHNNLNFRVTIGVLNVISITLYATVMANSPHHTGCRKLLL